MLIFRRFFLRRKSAGAYRRSAFTLSSGLQDLVKRKEIAAHAIPNIEIVNDGAITISRRVSIDPATHTHVKNAAMKAHQQFKLARRRFAATGIAPESAALTDQTREELDLQHREIMLGDVAVTQS